MLQLNLVIDEDPLSKQNTTEHSYKYRDSYIDRYNRASKEFQTHNVLQHMMLQLNLVIDEDPLLKENTTEHSYNYRDSYIDRYNRANKEFQTHNICKYIYIYIPSTLCHYYFLILSPLTSAATD